jgi:hypothetical protein
MASDNKYLGKKKLLLHPVRISSLMLGKMTLRNTGTNNAEALHELFKTQY